MPTTADREALVSYFRIEIHMAGRGPSSLEAESFPEGGMGGCTCIHISSACSLSPQHPRKLLENALDQHILPPPLPAPAPLPPLPSVSKALQKTPDCGWSSHRDRCSIPGPGTNLLCNVANVHFTALYPDWPTSAVVCLADLEFAGTPALSSAGTAPRAAGPSTRSRPSGKTAITNNDGSPMED